MVDENQILQNVKHGIRYMCIDKAKSENDLTVFFIFDRSDDSIRITVIEEGVITHPFNVGSLDTSFRDAVNDLVNMFEVDIIMEG